ncbi:MAG TPA: hypothetical protein VGE50_03100 [Gammaproteobacteria bacterium]
MSAQTIEQVIAYLNTGRITPLDLTVVTRTQSDSDTPSTSSIFLRHSKGNVSMR